MPKRRRKYVSPVGRQLPEMPEAPKRGDLWLWIGECLSALKTWIPYACQPETLCWDDPHESQQKERWEKIAVEDEYSGEAETAFESLREEGLWPETSEQAAFLMTERLDWAIRLTSQFSLLARSGAEIEPPSKNRLEVCRWLAIDLYNANFTWPKKWWDSSSFEDYYRR